MLSRVISPVVRPTAAVVVRGAAPAVLPQRSYASDVQPMRVTITGAAGQIGYALAARIANGDMLGKTQPVILQLLELPGAMKSLEGVCMELNDCAFPLLTDIVATDDLSKGFENTDVAMLVGARPRGPGTLHSRVSGTRGDADVVGSNDDTRERLVSNNL